MTSIKYLKVVLLCGFVFLLSTWVVWGTLSEVSGTNEVAPVQQVTSDYVGSETCQSCHENQFKGFSGTKHAKLENLKGWKDKVQGCESCHGPGKAHVEGGGDKTKIISFKNKSSKEISETCLACHAGKESHNNFRRGDHWRNNVGCTDCHTSHGSEFGGDKTGSITFIGETTNQKPGVATDAMLKRSEPQLCLSCHSETKAQFSKPFRHKVLEGTMNCSDCHNAHGGFEQKQVKLSGGVDASCIKCHADKQGPFVFEHAPLKVEGCSACHMPHGTANPKMLKRPQVRQLCLECHSGITDQLSDGPQGGPHDQRTIRSQNCTVCHAAIHGSNTSNVFFR